MENLLETAKKLDAEDRLGHFRDRFYIPARSGGGEQAYFCGHSLGLQSRSVESTIREELVAWRDRAVYGHFTGELPWMDCNDALCQQLAGLTGAQPSELVVMNTLSVNLNLLMVSFFRPQGDRRKILIEKHAFPSDRYAVASQLQFHGLDPAECMVELGPEPGAQLIEESQVEDYLRSHGDEVALVLWPGVQYITGQAFDLPRLAAAAHAAGSMIGFDLAHYIGNIPLSLDESGCDFAAWCHYKYLNSGPGAVGGCFVNQRHHQANGLPRFTGWWGNDRSSLFRMEHDFKPARGAAGWQMSNPPILAMAPIRASLALFEEAGMARLRQKSLALSDYLVTGIQSQLDDILEILTPGDSARRGCQLSLRVRAGRESGRELFSYLEQRGIITDWREPDVIRVAPVPLYNRFEDCCTFLQHISEWRALTGS
ncbi:MAG: kynureninase [Xanthomonadales bacterium]|nr:kynureninase [Gammaproteobacteria bacterium]NND56744.1 kynureninase [Xanthomonadales bacterium]NNK50960.1 kynureninase [Xanthomonadales bacterium]